MSQIVIAQAFMRGFAKAAARAVFKKRGNHSEAHLSEVDLETVLAATMEAFGVPELIAACRSADRLCKEALPKFNWAESALDANAIALLNLVPAEVEAALEKVRGGK